MSDQASSRFPFIWIVPLVALLVAGWLLHREYSARGRQIEVVFADGAGLLAGKTPVLHKGVTVGVVRAVTLEPGLEGVRATIELDPSAQALAADGAEFWLVHPEIGLSGVRGLDTLLSGARIHVRPGRGAPATRFTALPKAPATDLDAPGRSFVLRTDRLRSLHAGTGVYYREVKVGVVEDNRLATDATHVLVRVRIESPYDRLVRGNTHFWNSGGITMKLGLTGAQVHTNSLESLVAGGISFATPDAPLAAPAAEGAEFVLHEEGEKAWLKWAPAIDLTPAAR